MKSRGVEGAPLAFDRAAEIHHEIKVAVSELLRRKFVAAHLRQPLAGDRLANEARPGDRHLENLFARIVENEPAVQIARRHIAVDDRPLHATQRFSSLVDQVFARLGQHGNRHVVRNQILLDQHPHEVKVVRGSGGKCHFDLLETDLHEHIEIFELALGGHRFRQRLVAVTQIDGGPDGRFGNETIRPLPIFDLHRLRIAIFRITFHFLQPYICSFICLL